MWESVLEYSLEESGAFQFDTVKVFHRWRATLSCPLPTPLLPFPFSFPLFSIHFPPAYLLPLPSPLLHLFFSLNSHYFSLSPSLSFSLLLTEPQGWGCVEGKGGRGGTTACVTKPPIKFPQPITLLPPSSPFPFILWSLPAFHYPQLPLYILIFIHFRPSLLSFPLVMYLIFVLTLLLRFLFFLLSLSNLFWVSYSQPYFSFVPSINLPSRRFLLYYLSPSFLPFLIALSPHISFPTNTSFFTLFPWTVSTLSLRFSLLRSYLSLVTHYMQEASTRHWNTNCVVPGVSGIHDACS